MSTPATPPHIRTPEEQREVTFLTRETAPPSLVYVGPDDHLYLAHAGNNAGAGTLRARVMSPTGEIRLTTFNFAVAGDRAFDVERIDVEEGYLLSVTITSTLGTGLTVWAYAQMGISRGRQAANEFTQVLISGYLHDTIGLGYPGHVPLAPMEGIGTNTSFGGTDPAAGVEVSETVPTGVEWELLGWRATLVTDATVITRLVQLEFEIGLAVRLRFIALAGQGASSTVNYNACDRQIAGAAGSLEVYIPVPSGIRLPGTFVIRTVTLNLQAGDNYGAPTIFARERRL